MAAAAMDVSGQETDWRSANFRQGLVSQIEEAMRKAGVAHNKSSKDMESHIFMKAKTQEEYLSLVARLITHFRDIHNKKSQASVSDPMNALQNLTGRPLAGAAGMGMASRAQGAPMGGMSGLGPMGQQMSLPGQQPPGTSGMDPHAQLQLQQMAQQQQLQQQLAVLQQQQQFQAQQSAMQQQFQVQQQQAAAAQQQHMLELQMQQQRNQQWMQQQQLQRIAQLQLQQQAAQAMQVQQQQQQIPQQQIQQQPSQQVIQQQLQQMQQQQQVAQAQQSQLPLQSQPIGNLRTDPWSGHAWIFYPAPVKSHPGGVSETPPK